MFSWRVGIRFLTFKQDLVRNREVRSGELGINLNNVSSYTEPRFSRGGGNIVYLYIACCWNILICKSCSEYCVLLAEFWQTVDVIAGMQEKGNTSASSREIHQQIPGNTSSNSKEMGTMKMRYSFQVYPYLVRAFTNWLDNKDIIKTLMIHPRYHCQIYHTQGVKWVLRVIEIHREIAFPICSDNNSDKKEKQRQTYYYKNTEWTGCKLTELEYKSLCRESETFVKKGK